MRKTIAATVVLFALWIGYLVWPFASLIAVVRAAEAGDAAAISERVNFPSLRRSLAVQIIQTYARLTGTPLDSAGLTAGLGAAFADPFIEKLLSAEALAELLRNGWPKAVFTDGPVGTPGFTLGTLGDALSLYWNSDYGIGEVRVSVPATQPKEKQFRVELALNNWVWKLSGLGLPRDLQERFARELMKQQGKAG